MGLSRNPKREANMAKRTKKTRRYLSRIIKQEVDAWKTSGRIGTSHPRTKPAAVKRAVAVAFSKLNAKRKRARKARRKNRR